MTMLSFAWRWSSFTQDLALSSEAYRLDVSGEAADVRSKGETNSLGDVVYHYGAVGVAIVHGCQ